MNIEFRLFSSLAKIFPAVGLPDDGAADSGFALRGEVFSFQVAFRADGRIDGLAFGAESPIAECCQVRFVRSVPVEFVGFAVDGNMLSTVPGIYPDRLCETGDFRTNPSVWYSAWVTVRIPETQRPGKYPIAVRVKADCWTDAAQSVDCVSPAFVLEIGSGRLGGWSMRCTEWFYADCVYVLHKVAPWSDEHWALLEKYFRNMAVHGIRMLYTPLFTPPLDTAVGGERPTAQLAEVGLTADGKYVFDFSRLKRWVELALECGMEQFEMSHFFTQWGAEKCPKIVVAGVDGVKERRFGWHADALGAEYREFLAAFLPELTNFLVSEGIADRVYFHISDEPGAGHKSRYGAVSALLHRLLPGGKFLDALSNPEFFDEGLVDIPVPSVAAVERFADRRVPERWTYYCCGEWENVPNQFISMPSARNRILGMLMYYLGITGFLHWGYNFWYTQYSRRVVDPYLDTSAGGGFQPGDAFKVYPGADGPEDSIRHEVFLEAIQDHTALTRLEEKIGRKKVVEFIERSCGFRPSMVNYPKSADWLIRFREAVDRQLE
ncbi:MAG: DUF4091 domain-containing protein [Victivallaceae bacterium]|nr:DUF4091 domain-containing protein [Victivallaceae bacterium]